MSDDPHFLWRARQSTVYIIGSTNRTGSFLLCEGLSCTTLAGRPSETLSPEYRQELCEYLYGGRVDFSVSIKTMIRQGLTANGVFGVKVHWDQVEEIAFEAGYYGPTHTFLLEDFPDARYIHLSRKDTLAQAISLSIAVQTDEWWQMTGKENPKAGLIDPMFNGAEIVRLEKDLIRQRDAWEAFFAVAGITPLRMDYETLVSDYRGEVGRVLEFLGQDPTAAEWIPEPRLQKQGNALNELWKERVISMRKDLEPSSASL